MPFLSLPKGICVSFQDQTGALSHVRRVNQYTLNKSHITLTNQKLSLKNHKLFKPNLLISFSLWKHYIIHGAVNFTLLLFINNSWFTWSFRNLPKGRYFRKQCIIWLKRSKAFLTCCKSGVAKVVSPFNTLISLRRIGFRWIILTLSLSLSHHSLFCAHTWLLFLCTSVTKCLTLNVQVKTFKTSAMQEKPTKVIMRPLDSFLD